MKVGDAPSGRARKAEPPSAGEEGLTTLVVDNSLPYPSLPFPLQQPAPAPLALSPDAHERILAPPCCTSP